jgi:hypothetical protein
MILIVLMVLINFQQFFLVYPNSQPKNELIFHALHQTLIFKRLSINSLIIIIK